MKVFPKMSTTSVLVPGRIVISSTTGSSENGKTSDEERPKVRLGAKVRVPCRGATTRSSTVHDMGEEPESMREMCARRVLKFKN